MDGGAQTCRQASPAGSSNPELSPEMGSVKGDTHPQRVHPKEGDAHPSHNWPKCGDCLYISKAAKQWRCAHPSLPVSLISGRPSTLASDCRSEGVLCSQVPGACREQGLLFEPVAHSRNVRRLQDLLVQQHLSDISVGELLELAGLAAAQQTVKASQEARAALTSLRFREYRDAFSNTTLWRSSSATRCPTCDGRGRYRPPYARDLIDCPDCLTRPISTAISTTAASLKPAGNND